MQMAASTTSAVSDDNDLSTTTYATTLRRTTACALWARSTTCRALVSKVITLGRGAKTVIFEADSSPCDLVAHVQGSTWGDLYRVLTPSSRAWASSNTFIEIEDFAWTARGDPSVLTCVTTTGRFYFC